jgi:hypothetical protein
MCHVNTVTSGSSVSLFLGVTLTLNMNPGTMTRHPLFGFVPRMVTAKQVQGVIVRCVFAHSRRFFDVVVGRQ